METNSSSCVFDSFELWLLAAIPTAHLLLVGFGVPLKSIVFIAVLYETSEVPLTAPVGEFEWGRILPRACLTALNSGFWRPFLLLICFLFVGFGVPLKSIVSVVVLYETSEVPLTAPVGEFDWRRILPDEFEWGRILPRACLTALNSGFSRPFLLLICSLLALACR